MNAILDMLTRPGDSPATTSLLALHAPLGPGRVSNDLGSERGIALRKTERSEYQVYLASREWSLKREAVRTRSGNRCERCWDAPQQAVHHMTYEHTLDESLDELLAVCNPCHAWLSGKGETDPARWRFGRVFLAGGGLRGADDWRASVGDSLTPFPFVMGGPWDNTAFGLRDADCMLAYASTIDDVSRCSFDLGRWSELHCSGSIEDSLIHPAMAYAAKDSDAVGVPGFLEAESFSWALQAFTIECTEQRAAIQFVPDREFNIYGER